MFFQRPLLRQLSRLMLVWYVLFVGVSVLAATLQPKTMDVVCSTMGIMKVVVQGEGDAAPLSSSMDCPLCAHATPALPPPTLAALVHVHAARRLPYPLADRLFEFKAMPTTAIAVVALIAESSSNLRCIASAMASKRLGLSCLILK
jgi:hypothetical protein